MVREIYKIQTMAKKTLKLKDLFTLQIEIGEIVKQKLNILTRYKISEIKKSVDEALATAVETKDELIKKFGEVSETNQLQIKVFLDKEEKNVNPNFLEFVKEWDIILALEKEITYSPISLDSIKDVETETPIEIFFQLLEEPAEK